MHEFLVLVLAGVAGIFIGGIFFGGLWYTIRRGLSSGNPTLWFFASLMARLGVAMAGFYWVSGGRLGRLSACLGGFLLVRVFANRLSRRTIVQVARPTDKLLNAP